jgi:hypothetical protein
MRIALAATWIADTMFPREIHGVRKNVNDCPANAFLNDRKLERIVGESGEDGIDLRFEADTQANALALVSKRGIENLDFGLGCALMADACDRVLAGSTRAMRPRGPSRRRLSGSLQRRQGSAFCADPSGHLKQ